MNLEEHVAQITAQQGRRATGTWSRPDITLIYVSSYQYIPGKTLDVVTFEIKTSQNLGVTAVYEALAHRRAATMSYVLVQIPSDRTKESQPALEAVEAEANRNGIGLIVATDISDYATWEPVAEAERIEPDPEVLNDFIASQVSDENRNRILRWIR